MVHRTPWKDEGLNLRVVFTELLIFSWDLFSHTITLALSMDVAKVSHTISFSHTFSIEYFCGSLRLLRVSPCLPRTPSPPSASDFNFFEFLESLVCISRSRRTQLRIRILNLWSETNEWGSSKLLWSQCQYSIY